jgi:hypothetical protein
MSDMIVTPLDGSGRCLVGVRRLSRKTDKTSSPAKQARQVPAPHGTRTAAHPPPPFQLALMGTLANWRCQGPRLADYRARQARPGSGQAASASLWVNRSPFPTVPTPSGRLYGPDPVQKPATP